VDKLNCTLRASKGVASSKGQSGGSAFAKATADTPWFAELRTAMEFNLTGIRYRDYIADSAEGSLNSSDDILGLDRLNVRRKQNELNVHGRYLLPAEVGKFSSQPADVDVSLNAPEAADFWVADSPDRLSGPLQLAAQVQWKQEIANGQMWLAGSNLSMRDLVFRQVSAQCSISNNIIYLNDLSALLNDTDYVNATGRFNLRRPYHYSGRVSANVANLSTLQPLFHASGNQNQLAGSTTLDWEGNGDAQTFNNSGKLKFVLQKARYGNLQSLQANVDASYLPDGLDVPIIFFATSGMDFRAIAQAKGDKLEIDKIELNQVVKPQPQATRRSGARGAAPAPPTRRNYAYGYVSIPFVWRNLGTNTAVIPSSGKVSATIQSENLDLKKLFD